MEKKSHTQRTKPLLFLLDERKSLRTCVRLFLKQAVEHRLQDAVLRYLVGAKLELVLECKIEAHGTIMADSVTDRPGDYLIEDVVIHVTTSPGEALLRKCKDNLAQGLRPLIITTFKNVPVAETMADNAGILGRVEVFDVEQFVASNILELSKFKAASRKVTVANLIARYNRLAACENNPGLLIKEA